MVTATQGFTVASLAFEQAVARFEHGMLNNGNIGPLWSALNAAYHRVKQTGTLAAASDSTITARIADAINRMRPCQRAYSEFRHPATPSPPKPAAPEVTPPPEVDPAQWHEALRLARSMQQLIFRLQTLCVPGEFAAGDAAITHGWTVMHDLIALKQHLSATQVQQIDRVHAQFIRAITAFNSARTELASTRAQALLAEIQSVVDVLTTCTPDADSLAQLQSDFATCSRAMLDMLRWLADDEKQYIKQRLAGFTARINAVSARYAEPIRPTVAPTPEPPPAPVAPVVAKSLTSRDYLFGVVLLILVAVLALRGLYLLLAGDPLIVGGVCVLGLIFIALCLRAWQEPADLIVENRT